MLQVADKDKDLKPLVFLEIDTLTALRYRLHCVATFSVVVLSRRFVSKIHLQV